MDCGGRRAHWFQGVVVGGWEGKASLFAGRGLIVQRRLDATGRRELCHGPMALRRLLRARCSYQRHPGCERDWMDGYMNATHRTLDNAAGCS